MTRRRKYSLVDDLMQAVYLAAQIDLVLRVIENPNMREALRAFGIWPLIPDRPRDYSHMRGDQ